MEITAINRTGFNVDVAELEKLIELLEPEITSLPGEISVVFVDDPEISRLNEKYYGREGITDVLAFPYENNFSEIILNPYQHRRQAEKYDNTFNEETIENIIHALLHLAGYDHTSAEDGEKHLDRQHNLMDYIAESGFPPVISADNKNRTVRTSKRISSPPVGED